MKTSVSRAAGWSMGWLIVGLTVLPLLTASAESQRTSGATERLEQLLAKHDVRSVIYAASAPSSECESSDTEEGE